MKISEVQLITSENSFFMNCRSILSLQKQLVSVKKSLEENEAKRQALQQRLNENVANAKNLQGSGLTLTFIQEKYDWLSQNV
jgi:hypothetical protein